jgi:hypothetical protein
MTAATMLCALSPVSRSISAVQQLGTCDHQLQLAELAGRQFQQTILADVRCQFQSADAVRKKDIAARYHVDSGRPM